MVKHSNPAKSASLARSIVLFSELEIVGAHTRPTLQTCLRACTYRQASCDATMRKDFRGEGLYKIGSGWVKRGGVEKRGVLSMLLALGLLG